MSTPTAHDETPPHERRLILLLARDDVTIAHRLLLTAHQRPGVWANERLSQLRDIRQALEDIADDVQRQLDAL